MRKLFYLILVLNFSCSSGGDNEKINHHLSDGQYFFEIEFGGELHKIQGSKTEMFTNGQNMCMAILQQGYQVIQFRLNDITASDFVSGEPININLIVTNQQLGKNTGYIQVLPTSFTDNYAQILNINFLGNNFVENKTLNAIDAIQLGVVGKVTNINLSDLGSPSSSFYNLDGKNIKGSYEGVLYFIKNGWTNYQTKHDVPVPIKIKFNAPRSN